MNKASLLIVLFLMGFSNMFGQGASEDNLEEETRQETFHYPGFKAMKIGNLQSTKVASRKNFYMYVTHRFGTLNDGLKTFFGFDNANTKLQLVYGVFDGVQIGMGRESIRQTYSGHTKVRILGQTDDFPVNIVAYSAMNIRTDLRKEQYPRLKFADRISYASQLLVSRKLNRSLSLEIAPTYIRQNLVLEPFQDHNQLALGVGGRYKVGEHFSITADYVYNFSRHENSVFKDPLTFGLDIETGGHVFQLLFSNAQSTNEPGFVSNAEGNWSKGDVFFGFNIVRVF